MEIVANVHLIPNIVANSYLIIDSRRTDADRYRTAWQSKEDS